VLPILLPSTYSRSPIQSQACLLSAAHWIAPGGWHHFYLTSSCFPSLTLKRSACSLPFSCSTKDSLAVRWVLKCCRNEDEWGYWLLLIATLAKSCSWSRGFSNTRTEFGMITAPRDHLSWPVCVWTRNLALPLQFFHPDYWKMCVDGRLGWKGCYKSEKRRCSILIELRERVM